MSVYKPCDIRGPVAQLRASLYRRWGRALGNQVAPGAEFCVGGDLRPSTPAFKEALIAGLIESDIRVVDLGTMPTPMVYFAARTRLAAGCAIVTASHSPPGVNGLKWMIGALPPSEEDVQRLGQEATVPDHHGVRPAQGSRSRQVISDEYREWLAASLGPGSPPAQAHVVLDPKNGCWSQRARPYMQRLFPDAQISTIHDRPDGAFPDGNADCSRPEHLVALSHEVSERRAGLGIAFDGDGDRVAFVDAQGTALRAEEATWILLHSFGRFGGRSFVYDCKFSDCVAAEAAALGARPLAERSGHAFIRRRMIRSRAAFGAEISGHYFYGALQGSDDGLFSACRMIQHLSATGSSLAALRKTCPTIHMSPDLRLTVEGGQRDAVIEQIRAAFGSYPQQQIDGVRVDFPCGWALVRKSVTDSQQLTFRFEGESRKELEGIVGRVADALPSVGVRLCDQYEQTR